MATCPPEASSDAPQRPSARPSLQTRRIAYDAAISDSQTSGAAGLWSNPRRDAGPGAPGLGGLLRRREVPHSPLRSRIHSSGGTMRYLTFVVPLLVLAVALSGPLVAVAHDATPT